MGRTEGNVLERGTITRRFQVSDRSGGGGGGPTRRCASRPGLLLISQVKRTLFLMLYITGGNVHIEKHVLRSLSK
jgi:hypothetical protein